MPRQARESSGTGIYHVMMRGINHQNIFEEQEDYYQFLNTLDMMAQSYEPDGPPPGRPRTALLGVSQWADPLSRLHLSPSKGI